jgi:hypothetical protein
MICSGLFSLGSLAAAGGNRGHGYYFLLLSLPFSRVLFLYYCSFSVSLFFFLHYSRGPNLDVIQISTTRVFSRAGQSRASFRPGFSRKTAAVRFVVSVSRRGGARGSFPPGPRAAVVFLRTVPRLFRYVFTSRHHNHGVFFASFSPNVQPLTSSRSKSRLRARGSIALKSFQNFRVVRGRAHDGGTNV